MIATVPQAAEAPTARVLTSPEQIVALAPEWEALLSRSACAVPFLAPGWLVPWWRVFGPLDGRQPAAVCFESQGRLVGLALLCLRWHTYRPYLPFRRVELWGSGEDEQDGVCSEYLNVVAERGQEPAVASAFAGELVRWPSAWHELVVPLMDGGHTMPELLAQAFREKGLHAELTQTTSAPHIPLPRSWDEYLQRLGQRQRYFVRRSLRDFEAWAGDQAAFYRAETEQELARGVEVLKALHAERWGGGGTFRSPRFLGFHDEVMRGFRRRGALRLYWLEARGEPIAASYSLVHGGKLAFYQSGRRIDVPKNVRPGVVLHCHAIRRAIEEGLEEFDFLGGEARYKDQLALASRPLVQLRVARPGWRESARQFIEWGKSLLRRWFGRRAPAPPTPEEGDGEAS